MIKQGYNYLDRPIQEMPAFFETRAENLETPASPPTVRSISEKKKKKNSKKRKASSYEDSKVDSSGNKESPSKMKFSQYHGKCGHSADECTTVKAQIRKAK